MSLILALLLAWPAAAGPEADRDRLGDPPPPVEDSGRGADPFQLSPELGPEMSSELAKAQEGNLEKAAAAAEVETGATVRWLRGLLATARERLEAATAAVQSAARERAGGEGRDLGRLAKELDRALMDVEAAARAFDKKAQAAGLVAAERAQAAAGPQRRAYPAKNRAGDLRRAQADAARAQSQLGLRGLAGASAAAAVAADACATAVEKAAKELRGATEAVAVEKSAGLRDGLLEQLRLLEGDAKDALRETKLLRADLLLRRADRHLTGRPPE